jgi:type II secretory pathway pseudopilin PulG
MTLIEIMIAVAVLAIAIVGLLTAMPVATQATRDAEEHEVARHEIQNMIANIRGAAQTGGGWDSWIGSEAADGETGYDFDVEDLEIVQEDVKCGLVKGDDGEDGTRKVTVSVNWRGIDGAEREVVVTTLVALD